MKTEVNGVEFERSDIRLPEYLKIYDPEGQQQWAWQEVFMECIKHEEFKEFSVKNGYTGAQAVISFIRYLKAKGDKV